MTIVHLRVLLGMFATLASILTDSTLARANFDTPGLNPNATLCRFISTSSYYSYSPTAEPTKSGPVVIVWSPINGVVSTYEWYYPYGNDDEPYCSLSPNPPVEPSLVRALQTSSSSGRWELSALVATSVNPAAKITAQLFPNYTPTQANWLFAGILEETGSGSISAAGTVGCDL
jgi:hypothetical protein